MPRKPKGKRRSAAVHPKMSANLRRAVSIADRRAKVKPGRKTIPVIIEFDRKPTHRWIESLKRGIVKKAHHFQMLRRMSAMRVISARMSPHCLHRWCCHRNVKHVHLDHKLKVSLNVATPSVGASGLQRRGIGGRGVTIAIVDTGAYPHPDLTKPVNRIVAFKDLVGGKKKPYDDNGHGTHVAGDAAGNGFCSRGKYKGPANKARLVVVKAFDKNGQANSSDVVAAVDWILRNRKKYGIRIVNMSFGSPGFKSCSDDPVCRAAERAWRAGLVVVTAAGNSGPEAGMIESPGISPLLVTVGAVDDRRTVRQQDDRVAVFSGRGPVAGGKIKPDLTAPGVNIVSLRSPGSSTDRGDPSARVGKCYFKMSGTSMATPIVSGGAAQLLQRFPKLTNRRVKQRLLSNAFRLRGANSNAQGRGELNVRFIENRILPASK
ncbi:peptidase S8 [Paenibacillus hemerocallicola]|uniref:Peptidase S8 n=1 Tax=Paenibacillus hemerocallicola TaxID=1172614 RepID=A0A5C4TE20_9BACL|nr:S8 family peptidase [Paenibacillus hemerocallicola]TNJ67092.1 peptidase S8 [Paenibacillus hemerocallicola]